MFNGDRVSAWEDETSLGWTVVDVAQQWDCAQCRRAVHVNTGTMENVVLPGFHHNKKQLVEEKETVP